MLNKRFYFQGRYAAKKRFGADVKIKRLQEGSKAGGRPVKKPAKVGENLNVFLESKIVSVSF